MQETSFLALGSFLFSFSLCWLVLKTACQSVTGKQEFPRGSEQRVNLWDSWWGAAHVLSLNRSTGAVVCVGRGVYLQQVVSNGFAAGAALCLGITYCWGHHPTDPHTEQVLGGPAALLLQLQGSEVMPHAGCTVTVLSSLRYKPRALIRVAFSARLLGMWG